jgi:DNA polymerase III delta subunit
MVVLLHGPDTYRRGRKLRELLAAFNAKYAHADVLAVDLEEDADAWERARDFIVQPSLFSPAKALVVKESGVVTEVAWRKVLKYHKDDERFFLFVSDTVKPAKLFLFLTEPPAKVQEFPELTGRALSVFVRDTATRAGVTLSPEAARGLVARFEGREGASWSVAHELEKLALAGLPEPISVEEVRRVMAPDDAPEVSSGARVLLGNAPLLKKLLTLESILVAGVAPSYLFNSLAYQARGNQVVRLAELDVSVKSGGLEYEEALTEFVLGA